MAARIDKLQRIVVDVSVTVKSLRITRKWDNRIRLDKSPKLWIKVTGLVVIKAGFIVQDLSGEPVRDGKGRIGTHKALLAEGTILVMLHQRSVAVGDDARRAQVVVVVVIKHGIVLLRFDGGVRGGQNQGGNEAH